MEQFRELVEVYNSGGSLSAAWYKLSTAEKTAVKQYCAEHTFDGIIQKIKISSALQK